MQPVTKMMKPLVNIITFLNLCEIKYENQIESDYSCAFGIPPSRIKEFHSNKKRRRSREIINMILENRRPSLKRLSIVF